MSVINPHDNVITLINTFEVDPENQQALIDLLVETTTDVMRHVDGFVSANLHKGLDGNHVANYAQWKSMAHLEAMMANPEAQARMKQAAQLANKVTPVLYQAVYTDSVNSK